MKKLAKNTTVITLAAAFTLVGCSLTQNSPVPGIKNSPKITHLDPIPIGDVLTAVQIQLGQAFSKIATNSNNLVTNNNVVTNKFSPQAGKGSFSGAVQLVKVDNASILAAIPFSGYADSMISPNLGISSTATSIESTTVNFAFNPNNKITNSITDAGDIGDCVSKSVVAAFDQLAGRKSGSGPAITAKELVISTSFAVQRKEDAGLGIKLVPKGDLDSITAAPAIGVSRQPLGTYKLDLTIPLGTSDPGDAKRIIHGLVNGNPIVLIDRPYDINILQRVIGSGTNNLTNATINIKNTEPAGNPLYVEPEYSN